MSLPVIPYYDIVRVISEGGSSAIVYWGVDLRSGFPVAIKRLRKECMTNKDFLKQFKAEANNYLYLRHPNLTKLVDYVEYRGEYYLIMEYVEGIPLNVFQRKVIGPMPDEMAIPMFLQMLDTIEYIHSQGMIHRDIKPNNILVCEGNHIKILDMGISSKLQNKDFRFQSSGTWAFMPPEQFDGAEQGCYTDIFSLGVTFYSMLTNHLPFYGRSFNEYRTKMLNSDYPDPRIYYPPTNEKLIPIIKKALKPDPWERYQSCKSMKNAILAIQ